MVLLSILLLDIGIILMITSGTPVILMVPFVVADLALHYQFYKERKGW